MTDQALAQFGADYARHRAAEGRGYTGEDLFSLPYLRHGPLAAQWAVRARSFHAFLRQVVRPLAEARARPLDILDLGAGNGWLSHRMTLEGHRAIALDIREDLVDGLGAAEPLVRQAGDRMECLAASFETLPLRPASMDIAVFNAALHYTVNLPQALGEAARVVRSGGVLAIVDTPFYRRDAHGRAMVAEKKAQAAERFGAQADSLLALPFLEYLTRESLAAASAPLGLRWRRHRVLYPIAYELRPLRAALRGDRPPSRFDLWTAVRP